LILLVRVGWIFQARSVSMMDIEYISMLDTDNRDAYTKNYNINLVVELPQNTKQNTETRHPISDAKST
jgi:hypothetical protein